MQREQERQEQQPRVVAVIPKGPNHELRVSLATHRGRTFGDLRLWVLKDGNMIPTPRGVTVDVWQLEELESAIVSLRDAAAGGAHPF